MKKYWIIFKNCFQASLIYRADIFLMLFFEVFSLLFLVYLWFSIYNQGNQVGNYSLKNLIFYYIFVNFISASIGAWSVARQMDSIISSGDVSNYLTKPISFMLDMFFDNLGSSMQRISIHLLLALVIILVYNPFNSLHLFYFAISIILAIIINFFIFYITGLATFYFGTNIGVSFFVLNVIQFFSGSLIPLDILPKFFLNLSNYLPFKFLGFIPISILNGRMEWSNIYLLEFSAWILILFLLSSFLYKNGLKKYESYGG